MLIGVWPAILDQLPTQKREKKSEGGKKQNRGV
jgi:hypothetical protein